MFRCLPPPPTLVYHLELVGGVPVALPQQVGFDFGCGDDRTKIKFVPPLTLGCE